MLNECHTPQEIERTANLAGLSILELCRRARVASTSFFRWKNGRSGITLDTYDRLVRTINNASKGQPHE